MDKCYGIIYQQYECNNPNCESVKEKHAKTPAKLAQLTAMDESGDLKKICMSEENPTKLRGLGVSFASIDPRLIGDDGLLPDELRVRYHVKLYPGQPGGWDAELAGALPGRRPSGDIDCPSRLYRTRPQSVPKTGAVRRHGTDGGGRRPRRRAL